MTEIWRCWNNHVNEKQGKKGSNPQCTVQECPYRRFDDRYQGTPVPEVEHKFELSKDRGFHG